MNYARKYLTGQKFYEHKYSNTCRIYRRICFKSIILEPAAHVEYLGKYVFKSIILNQLFRTVGRGWRELGFGEGTHWDFQQVEMSGR